MEITIDQGLDTKEGAAARSALQSFFRICAVSYSAKSAQRGFSVRESA